MAVELPEPLQWVLLLLAGTRWPEADEDQLRHMADHCRKAAENLKDAARSADSTLKRALDGQQGTAAEALGKYWEKYTVGKGTQENPGYLPGAINSLNGMGDMLEQMANSAETAKIQIIAQLGILAFELATAEAEAPFTAGASLLQVPVMIGASRVVVSQLLKQLLKEMVEMAAKQAAQMAAINLLAQGIELAEGHRKSIDMGEVGQNALGGAVGGASAHLIGKGIGAAGKKLGAENALNSTAGKMATGAVIGVGADVSTQLITTGTVDGGSLLGSGLSGGAGAGLHAGASAIKGHMNAPTPAEAPKLDLPGTTGHDGPPTFTKPATSSGDSTYRGPSGTVSGDSGSSSGNGSGSNSGATETTGTGTRSDSGTESALGAGSTAGTGTGAGSSVGHTSATGAGAGESKVNGLTPFGSDRSTGTTAGTATGTTTHETAAPPAHEQAGARTRDTIAPDTDMRTAAPRNENETEPVMVRSAPPATAQPHETAAPPAEHVAAQVHETPVPHQEPAAQPHETTAPRVEPVLVQPHETTAPPAEHVAAQVHETPVPHQEPTTQPHETTAPRVEPVLVQPHETAAPRVEPVLVQPHETAAPVTESTSRQEPTPTPTSDPHGSGASRSEHAAVPSHEAAAPVGQGEGVRVAEQPAAAAERSAASGVPNLSGAFGGGGRPAGGGDTHLDGGTRLAAGPGATRTAGPESGPGQVLPDGLAEAGASSNTGQNPANQTAGVPMAGGFGSGPVGGAPGHRTASPSASSPSPTPPSTPPRQGDGRSAGGPVQGGTIRPGAGRASEQGPGGGLPPTARSAADTSPAKGEEPPSGQPSEHQRPETTLPADVARLRQDLAGMSPHERAQEIANLTPEDRRRLARDPQTVDALKNGLPPHEFARAAAELIVHVDPRAERAASARQEAQQQVARLLQDPDTTARLLKNGADVVIVPKDVRMTDVPGLYGLRGVHNHSEAGDGRGYDDMRGSGGRHSAVTEENLLGEDTSIGNGGHHQDGYSTTTHEFSHTVHRFGLDPHDRSLIKDTFAKKQADPDTKWPDGPTTGANGEKNYSSRDEQEYFAQLTNAYLGTNRGTDPFTGEPRNNGADWVRRNEPELLPLLEKLYGPDPSHQGQANPVRATAAENEMYAGLREFTDHVEGNDVRREQPDHQPPAEHRPPAEYRPQHDATRTRDLPPPPPPQSNAQHSSGSGQAKPDDDKQTFRVNEGKVFDTIEGFLGGSKEFKDLRSELENYGRDALLPADTNAIRDQYRYEKLRHVDLLSRNADELPKAIDRVNERMQAVDRELADSATRPERAKELTYQKTQLEAARKRIEDQRDRMAIFEHERLKDGLRGAELAARTRARQEAEARVLAESIERIKAEATRNEELLKQARRNQQEAKTPSKVHQDRINDLERRKTELETARKQRAEDLEAAQKAKKAAEAKPAPAPAGSARTDGVPAPSTKEAWKKFEDSYRKAFGYSDHGVMAQQPHAEKVIERTDEKKGVMLAEAMTNRNHVIADYMVHKYVTAAVFKARSLDPEDRPAATDAFSDFVTAMAPDRHRVYDKAGDAAERRLAANGPEEAALVRRDLTATIATVDLKAVYGNDRLPSAFDTTGIDSHRAAADARATLERELGRNGLDLPARSQLDELARKADAVHPDSPTTGQLDEVRKAVEQVHRKVKEQALEDLALVNGVTGPRLLDDTAAALHTAEANGGPRTENGREQLAGRLDDLAARYDAAGQDPARLRALAGDLRSRPDLVTGDRLGRLADQLPKERNKLRQEEIKQRLAEVANPIKAPHRDDKTADAELAKAERDRDDAQKKLLKAQKKLDGAIGVHTAAKKKADASGDKTDVKAERDAAKKVKSAREALENAQDKLAAAPQDVAAATVTRDRVTQVYQESLADHRPADAGRVAWAVADLETVGRQYGGAFARAGAGANHPAGIFDRALTAGPDELPALITEMTVTLSNSASNLRFGDELVNKWIQNFLDPHVIRDPELLTAVAHEQLPPEVLYAPHTADLLQAVRGLEANGLVPPELRDIMAPKTQEDMDASRKKKDASASAVAIANDLGIPAPGFERLPVSSSGDFSARADGTGVSDDRLGQLGTEGLYQPDRVVPQPTSDQDVVMADAGRQNSGRHDGAAPPTTHTPDGDVQMNDGTGDTGRPDRKRRREEDTDSDSEANPGPSVRRRLADLDLDDRTPPPPPPVSIGTGSRGFGGVSPHSTPQPSPHPAPQPPAVTESGPVPNGHGGDAPAVLHGAEPMDLDTPPHSPAAEQRSTPPVEERSAEERSAEEHGVDRDGDTVMQESTDSGSVAEQRSTPPVEERSAEERPAEEHGVDGDDDTVMQESTDNSRKRGREEDEESSEGPDAKRQRTPAYENSFGVMEDRGYRQIGPQHPLTGDLVSYLGGAPRVHPPMSNSLLQKVNPHQEPAEPVAGFRPGNDLMSCLENVEAYRDTHFGRPRVSGQTKTSTAEPIPGNTLWKRHNGPALFGQGTDAVKKLMDQVRAGGPGSFATVLGIGAQGGGHVVALVHDRDGTLRWADLTDRKVTTAIGQMPDHYRSDWTVWASVADPRENDISGPHDPGFMERYSTFGESAHPSDPMDIDTFGAPHRTAPDLDSAPTPTPTPTPNAGTPKQTPPNEDRPTGPEDDGSAPLPAKAVSGENPVGGGTSRPRAASAPPELGTQLGPVRQERTPSPGRKDTERKDAEREDTSEPLTPPAPKAERTFAEREFPPVGPPVQVAADGLCLLHSIAVGMPEPAGNGSTVQRLRTAVENHFSTLPPEQWPTEVVSNYRNNLIARGALSTDDLLGYLPSDTRQALAGMPPADVRRTVSDHLTENTPPPSAREREALLRTVRNWEDRWLTDEGEMLPAAAAHALGLSLRVVGHDGIPRAVFGPADGRQVTVYHQGNHYDGSRPVPPAAETHPPAVNREAAKQEPVPGEMPQKPQATPDAEQKPSYVAPEQPKTPDAELPQGSKQEPEPEPEPVQQSTATGPRSIAGTDLVVGLTGNETAVRKKVIDVLARAVPGDRAAARAFADAHFGPATLRPMIGALSRGETWTVPFEGNGWSGSVKLSGQITGTEHRGTEKIEFENGSDRMVATGTNQDAQWQFNVGLQTRQAVGMTEPAELVGYFHDRGHGEVNMDFGGMVARSKTSELANVFASTMRLELDFGGLRHDDTPVRTASGGRTDTVDLGMTVAVPARAEATADGEQRTPPQRLLDGRVGGQEIVLDLVPRGGSTGRRPVEALLDHVEQAAEREFGNDWPAMREKVLAEVDFGRLQQNLKSMTAGEPVAVVLTDGRGRRIGTVEIGARVGDLRQTGSTEETEFNIGTAVQQVRSSATTSGNAGQLGVAGLLRPGAALIGTGGAERLGRDGVEILGDSRVSQLTSKSKVPGVVYGGAVRFELAFNGKADTHEAGSADVRLLVDRADTGPEAGKAGTEDTGTTPPKSDSEPPSPEPEPEPSHEVAAPPESVWHGGDDRGGLDETVVVRDVESTVALRAAVDAEGRKRFGDDWDSVRDQVMRGFSQPNLAARLTGMTRGEALEVKVPGKEDLVIRAVARVEGMTYRREDGKAELNTLNETSSFSVDRGLLARTDLADGQLGGTVAKGTPGGDLLATGSVQQRERAGGQGRQADRVYANGKYGAPQVIYGAALAVDIHFGRPGEAAGAHPAVSAPVRVEVGMDARETVKVRAARGEDGTIAFKPPAGEPAGSTTPGREDGPGADRRDAIELDRLDEEGRRSAGETPRPGPDTPPAPRHDAAKNEPAATHTAPRRMSEQHELNASYVVHTLKGADKVRTTVEDAVRAKHGEPSEKVQQRLDAAFDRIALKAKLSQLTRGGNITETVSGTTWKAEVTVTARLADAAYHSETDKYEFESGTRTSSGQGNLRDMRRRKAGGWQFKVKAPGADVAGGHSYRVDRSYGRGVETVGSASNRGKHVEPAVFFDVGAAYDVTVKFTRLGMSDGTVTRQVDTVARVAVPARDAVPVSGAVERTTEKQPGGFAAGRRRLDSSAIVTDVHVLPQATDGTGGRRRTMGESIRAQVESGWKPRRSAERRGGKQRSKRNPFASDWEGISRKLDAELTPDRLQSRLKGMTAGDEIVVRHGQTTVRVSAVLRDGMQHLGDTGTTEFNTGTDVQRSFADTSGTGTGHQGVFGVVGAVPVPGAPVSVTVGVTGTGGRGQDHVDVRNSSTSAGMATKAKLPGSAYRGEAELQFTITRRPWLGASVYQRRTAAVGFETIVETGETVPVPSRSAGGEPPRTVPVKAPEAVGVPVPPERVWKTGLRDTDVLRFLGDVGGVQDLVRLRGEEYFGKSAWETMAPAVGTVTKHSHLSALFGAATQGAEVAATVPTGRVSLGGGKGVEVGVKVVSLEHRDTDSAVELSPANTTSAGTVHAGLSARNAGAQGQIGAKITGDVTHSPALTGGAQRLWREGGSHGDSGQTVSNGKIATPMARYTGHAEVEVRFFDGNRTPVAEKGIVPFTVDLPLSETTGTQVPGDHYLAFTGDRRSGELRFDADARILDEVHGALAGSGRPFDHAAATPAESARLTGTVRLGRALYGGEFTIGTEAGLARVRATHRLVEMAGGTSEAAATLLGGLLGTPDGTPLPVAEARKAIDYAAQQTAEGPFTLDDLITGAQDGWPAHPPYDVHRAAWTDHGPANGLVTAAMATAADAVRPLLAGGVPTGGRLHLTVTGEGAELPLHQEHRLDGGDPAEQIRKIEQATYLKPGTSPREVTVRLAGAPGLGEDWDYRVTARADRSRELTLRHRTPTQAPPSPDPDEPQAGAPQADGPSRDAAAARVAALGAFVAGRGGAPEASD